MNRTVMPTKMTATVSVVPALLFFVVFSFLFANTVFFETSLAYAASSCTHAIHEADRTRMGEGTIESKTDFDLGNCGSPAGASPTSGAYENARFLNLPAGKYRINTTARYGNSSDEHILVLTSDGSAATILDLNGSNPSPATLSGETTIDLCNANGSITIRAYSQTKPAAWDFQGVSVQATRVGSGACGGPIACVVYGVDDQGKNNSQFFTLDPVTKQVKNIGTPHKGADIEALDIDPVTRILYAGASASAEAPYAPGNIYAVNTTTGALTSVGKSGFGGLEGLSVRPSDGVLWGLSSGGLITIDVTTGAAALKKSKSSFPFSYGDAGIAWNAEGTLLYLVHEGSSKLYTYNPLTGAITEVADHMTINSSSLKETNEALEMRPDGLLLSKSKGTLYAYDPITKQVVVSETYSSMNVDAEGIAWPEWCKNPPPTVAPQPLPIPLPPPPQSDQNPSAINTPPSPTEGGNVTFKADITNQGNLPSTPSTGRFRMDLNNDGTFDSTISTHAVGAISPGNTITITSGTWTAVVGTHRIEFCADVNGVDSESNEANNCRSQIFTVAFALPLSSNLIIKPPQVLSSQKALVTWTSSNAATCTISGPGIAFSGSCSSVPKACNGQQQTPPINAPTEYTFQCNGSSSQVNTTKQTVQPVSPSFNEQ